VPYNGRSTFKPSRKSRCNKFARPWSVTFPLPPCSGDAGYGNDTECIGWFTIRTWATQLRGDGNQEMAAGEEGGFDMGRGPYMGGSAAGWGEAAVVTVSGTAGSSPGFQPDSE
jgi:hypothetical protein